MDYILTLGQVPAECVDYLSTELATAEVISFDPDSQYRHWQDAEAVGIECVISRFTSARQLKDVVAVIMPEEPEYPQLGAQEWDWLDDKLLFSVNYYRVVRYADGSDRYILRKVDGPVNSGAEVLPRS